MYQPAVALDRMEKRGCPQKEPDDELAQHEISESMAYC